MIRKMYKFTAASLVFLLLWSSWSGVIYADSEPEQPIVEWSQLYGGSFSSEGRSVTATSDGGYIAIGNIQSTIYLNGYAYPMDKLYAVKVDSNGAVQWERDVTSQGVYGYEPSYGYDVLEASDGSFIITGYTTDSTARPTNVIYITKLTASGTIQWNKAYPQFSNSYYHIYGEEIAETASGDFVITGYSASSPGYAPAYLLKINSNGDVLWYKTLWLDDIQYFNDITATADGGVIAVGAIDNYIDSSMNAAIIVKFNNLGETVWEKVIQKDVTVRPSASVIHPAHGGGYLITGILFRYDDSNNYIQKINENGDVLWETTFDPTPGYDSLSQIQTIDGGYALIGRSTYGDYIEEITTKYEIVLIDENGALNKTYVFGDSNLNSVGKGVLTADDGFLVVGTIKNGTSYHLQLTKISVAPDEPADPELSKIEFEPQHLQLSVGQSVNSVVNAVYSDNSVKDITHSVVYQSLDPDIAYVDSFGQITGVHSGTTVVTAAYEGQQANVTIEVTSEGSGDGIFYLDSDEYSLSIGTELDVAAFFIDESENTSLVTLNTTFSSDDPSIATIDEYGNIYGVSPGITYITATYNGLTYRASVWVVKPYVPHS